MSLASSSSRVVGLLLLALPLLGADGQVTRTANLREGPSGTSAVVAQLDASSLVQILDPTPQNGYLRVRTSDGQEGWVWARNVQFQQTRARGRHPTPFASRLAAARRRSSGPCAASLDQCPVVGCEKAGTPHALLNQRKRTVPPESAPVALSFQDFRSLQAAADNAGIAQGSDLDETARHKLQGLSVGGRTLGEASVVQLAGFVSPERNLQKGSAESVNCRLTGVDETDVHVPLVEDAEGSEYESVVVEPIPQSRPATWNLALWRQVQRDGTRMLVRGQLMYDNLHQVNDDPAHPQSGQPKRFTLWEIHPITAVFLCARPSNDCDPADPSQWDEVH